MRLPSVCSDETAENNCLYKRPGLPPLFSQSRCASSTVGFVGLSGRRSFPRRSGRDFFFSSGRHIDLNPIALLLLSTGSLAAWFGAGTLFIKVEQIYSMPFFGVINDLLERYFLFYVGFGAIMLIAFLSFLFFR